jgi:protein-disulfide isomerase-like protein with CxxC motif
MRFEINFDYLCPFARNANEAVIAGLGEGRDWDVTFRPFSLSQVHVDEGEPPVFDDAAAPGVLALHWGVAIRDDDPEHFPAAHVALFAARHDDGGDIADPSVIKAAVDGTGVDVDAIAAVVASGTPAKTLAAEHSESVDRWAVFGVPTFIKDDVATFIRFMDRGNVTDLDRALAMLDWQGLNEFKRTRRAR